MAEPNIYLSYLPNYSNRTITNFDNGPSKTSIGNLRFPTKLGASDDNNLTIPFTLFMPYKRKMATFYSAQSGDFFYDQLPQPEFAVALPTPVSALKATYGVAYDTATLGQFVGGMVAQNKSMSEIFLQAATASAAAVLATGSPIAALAGAAFGATGGSALVQGGYQSAKYLATLAGSSENAIDLAFGVAENPYTENVFKNVEPRTHEFSYTFMPKNSDDSTTIDAIISIFKYAMLPRPTAALGFFDFPYEFQIVHSVTSTTFALLPCVLTSLVTDFGGGTDTLKMFKMTEVGQQWPAKITLSMTFKEVMLLDRTRVEEHNKFKTLSDSETNPLGNASGKRFRF